MKFGVLQFFSWPERRVPLQQVYKRALQRIDIMDKTGYDAVWLAEHHFSTYSVCPSVHLMGMHVADKTANLRIGMGVSLAAFYHPLRLAEEVALLDNLSGGRINWGAGRGFDSTEMKNFGVRVEDSYERFHENVDIVLKAWQPGSISHHGKYHQFDEVEVLPKPLQNPMPVWMATTTEQAVRWAASQGHAILMDPHSPHTEIGSKLAMYRAELNKAGHAINPDIPIARLIAIADSDKKAEAVARAGATWTVQGFAKNKKHGGPGAVNMSTEERVEQYMREVIIHGSPASVIGQLQQLRDKIDLKYLLASTLSHDTFLHLTNSVIPKFQ